MLICNAFALDLHLLAFYSYIVGITKNGEKAMFLVWTLSILWVVCTGFVCLGIWARKDLKGKHKNS